MPASTTIGRCASCGRLRPLDELLAVTNRRTLARSHCCRPTLDDQRDNGCFRRSIGWVGRDEIRLATSEARP